MNELIKKITLKIAEFSIQIEIYQGENKFFRDSLLNIFNSYSTFFVKSNKNPDFIIKVKNTSMVDYILKKENKIEKYYKISAIFYPKKRTVIINHFTSQAEFEMILKEILSKYLLINSGFFMHGSASLLNKEALLFIGNPGSGKSTITKLIENKMRILADDIFIIRKINKKIFFFQTPFHEKNYQYNKYNCKYPIKCFFILKKNHQVKLYRLKNECKKLSYILDQLLIPHKNLNKNQLKIIKDLSQRINFYILHFSLEGKRIIEKIIHKLIS